MNIKTENIDFLFEKNELIPAVIQDASDSRVLMLAYMNRESLALTIREGRTWFWSRSRKCLWEKGATLGHFQTVREIYYDCEDNSLLIKVDQTGVPCHTGEATCFYRRLV